MVGENLVLPVGDHSISFLLLSCPILIFYIHSCVVMEFSHSELAELFGEQLLSLKSILMSIHTQVILKLSLLPFDKALYSSIFLWYFIRFLLILLQMKPLNFLLPFVIWHLILFLYILSLTPNNMLRIPSYHIWLTTLSIRCLDIS